MRSESEPATDTCEEVLGVAAEAFANSEVEHEIGTEKKIDSDVEVVLDGFVRQTFFDSACQIRTLTSAARSRG